MRVNQPNKNLHQFRKYIEKCDLPYGLISYLTNSNEIWRIPINLKDEHEGVRKLNEIEKFHDFKQFL